MGRSPEVARSGKRRHVSTTLQGNSNASSGISVGQDTINDAAGFATQQNLREVLQLPLRFGRLGALTARQ
jgi:hypothetical protein